MNVLIGNMNVRIGIVKRTPAGTWNSVDPAVGRAADFILARLDACRHAGRVQDHAEGEGRRCHVRRVRARDHRLVG
jgi:hypothetical protein